MHEASGRRCRMGEATSSPDGDSELRMAAGNMHSILTPGVIGTEIVLSPKAGCSFSRSLNILIFQTP